MDGGSTWRSSRGTTTSRPCRTRSRRTSPSRAITPRSSGGWPGTGPTSPYGRRTPWTSTRSSTPCSTGSSPGRFRAVENGRWVVHAAISGISAFIDPHGGVHDPTGLFELALDRHAIQASTALTIYTRFGDYFPWVSLGLAGLMVLAPPRRRPARRVAGPLPERVRILVIVPTYNERPTIGAVIERTLGADGRIEMLVV